MNDNNIFTEERTAQATGEILINRAEFREAVSKVIKKQVNDPTLEGMAKFIVPMSGAAFATDMEEILFGFGEEDQEG